MLAAYGFSVLGLPALGKLVTVCTLIALQDFFLTPSQQQYVYFKIILCNRQHVSFFTALTLFGWATGRPSGLQLETPTPYQQSPKILLLEDLILPGIISGKNKTKSTSNRHV